MQYRAFRGQNERGSGMVELALVAPLAIAILLGVVTGGHAYFQKISLVDAVRDGARYGASLKVPPGGIAEWRQAVRGRVAALSGGQVTAAQVCADLVTPTGTNTACGVGDPQGAASDPTALTPASLVKVSVAKETRIEFIFYAASPMLSSKVAARYERDIL